RKPALDTSMVKLKDSVLALVCKSTEFWRVKVVPAIQQKLNLHFEQQMGIDESYNNNNSTVVR
ncbi:3581_t:CDS:1, partial [Paraglomus occultum]